jgi:hypothetical protein
MGRSKTNQPARRGPEPETLAHPGPWEEVVKKVLSKKRPEGGWPKPEKKGRGK